MELVFGYASLVPHTGGTAPARSARPAVLLGARRFWGVAMDNRVRIPGYKVWLDAAGRRPRVHVAFLDLRDAPGAAVDGVLRPVDAAGLALLDDRERNYARVDVTHRVPGAPGRVWAYVGTPEARRRLATAPRAVVARPYLELVRAGFARRGLLHRFDATTDPARLPVADLRRVDVPAAGRVSPGRRPPPRRRRG